MIVLILHYCYSAVGREAVTEDAFNMGATYYVMKPFDNNMLIDRIKYIGGIINIKPVNMKKIGYDSIPHNKHILENEITGMIHEIGVPAHIKGLSVSERVYNTCG